MRRDCAASWRSHVSVKAVHLDAAVSCEQWGRHCRCHFASWSHCAVVDGRRHRGRIYTIVFTNGLLDPWMQGH